MDVIMILLYLIIVQGASNIAQKKKHPEPYILLTGDINDPDQAFLVIDCQIIGEVELKNIPITLLAAYFVFNICYVKGCHNMYSYLEVLFLNASPDKVSPTVKHFMTALANV